MNETCIYNTLAYSNDLVVIPMCTYMLEKNKTHFLTDLLSMEGLSFDLKLSHVTIVSNEQKFFLCIWRIHMRSMRLFGIVLF